MNGRHRDDTPRPDCTCGLGRGSITASRFQRDLYPLSAHKRDCAQVKDAAERLHTNVIFIGHNVSTVRAKEE